MPTERLGVVEAGSGTPVVLIHGFGVDHRLLLPLEPVFEASGGWRRLYLDLPGTEGAPLGDVASSAGVVRAIEDEIAARLGDEPFVIVGNSWGGMLARQVAHDLRGQVLGLAVLAGLFVADEAARDVDPRTVLRVDTEALGVAGAAADAYAETAVVQSVENAEAFVRYAYPGIVGADQAALARIHEGYALDVDPEDGSPEPWEQPALFLMARQDNYVGYRDAWARVEHYPRATFAVLDAAGHNVHVDQPGVAAALVGEWLARVRTAL